MNIAQTIPLADSWGMHGDDVGAGWLIVFIPLMVLFMGGVMWMMMRGMGGGSSRDASTPGEGHGSTETPVEILERRFAEGSISLEDYQARREVLVKGTAADPQRKEL